MAILSRDAITAAAKQLRTIDVEVPRLGGTVRLREMTAGQRDRWEASVVEVKGKDQRVNLDNVRASLVVRCLVGEDDKPLFTEKEADTVLAHWPAEVMVDLFERCQRLNGLTEADVDELVGNSDGTPAATSPSS